MDLAHIIDPIELVSEMGMITIHPICQSIISTRPLQRRDDIRVPFLHLPRGKLDVRHDLCTSGPQLGDISTSGVDDLWSESLTSE